MSNIAEGFERGGSAEFLQFLSVAKGSAAEVETQLYVAFDQGYVTEEKFRELQTLVRSVVRLLMGFVNYLKTSDIRGQKYKKHHKAEENRKPKTVDRKPNLT